MNQGIQLYNMYKIVFIKLEGSSPREIIKYNSLSHTVSPTGQLNVLHTMDTRK